MTDSLQIPTSFKIIAVLAILWNLFGVFSFIGHAFIPEQTFAGMTADQKTFMDGYPAWGFIVFGTAVTTGLLGSIGLLLRKKWAILLFLISLITLLINQFYPILFTNYMEIFGGASTLILPIILAAVAIALWYYAKQCDAKGWLS
ncbi:MAG: hypothetical protein ACI9FN_003574 [Saprospiraceae bacterium]|jgi:hypothetical protein